MANVKHLTSPAGILQMVHLIFGIIAIRCGEASYESQFIREGFFYWSVFTLLIVSVLLLVISVISGSPAVKALSSGLHFIGGIVLIAAGTMMILSVQNIQNDELFCAPNPFGANCNYDKSIKLAAASFAIINGILYLTVSVLIFVVVKQDKDAAGYLEAERSFARPKP